MMHLSEDRARSNFWKRIGYVAVTFFYALFCSALPAAQESVFKITEGEKPACAIVTGSQPDERTDHSAAVLKKILKSITKQDIAVVRDGTESHAQYLILLGQPSRNSLAKEILTSSGVKLDKDATITELTGMKNGDQGFVIRFAPCGTKDCVVLAGNTPQGTFYAVQTFADRVSKSRDGVFGVDRKNVLTAPAFKYRSLTGSLGGPDWLGTGQFENSFGRPDGSIDVKAFIDWVARYRVNNLNIWMFDFMWGLVYPSEKYPEAVNGYHPNVRNEFFGELLEYAKRNYIDIWLLVDFPDRWLGVLMAYPELAEEGFQKLDVHQRDAQWWRNFYSGGGGFGYDEYQHLSFDTVVCPNKPATMKFWKGFWEEVLTKYPLIAGIGGQFGEHFPLHMTEKDAAFWSCGNYFVQNWLYFRAMAEVGDRVRPGLNYWIFSAKGAREIVKHRKELPNLTYIGWGGYGARRGTETRPPVAEQQKTKVNWYLSHGGSDKWYEWWFKKHSLEAQKLGLEGIQKRMVLFQPYDKVYFAVSVFGWSPETTMKEFAEQYVMRKLHVKDARLAKAYELEMEIQSGKQLLELKTEQADILKDKTVSEELQKLVQQ